MDLRSQVFTVCLWLVIVLIIGCDAEKKLNGTCYKPCHVKSGPVCGNDGRNYSTPCHLSVARCQARKIGQIIYVKSKGFCRSSKPLSACALNCTARRQPLCGSDNLTYKNLCLFKKAKCEKRKKKMPTITVLSRKGPCPRTKPTKSKSCRKLSTCPKVKRPVCGSDNKTYKNICHLKTRNCNMKNKAITRGWKAKKLILQYCGACGRSKKCQASLSQQKCPSFKLCDQLLSKARRSSGVQRRVGRSSARSKTGKKSGKGTKHLSTKKTMKKTKSKGKKTKKPKKVNLKVKRQFMVCGSDGRNYVSICHLQVEQCNKRSKCQRLQMRYKGPCKKN